jgi:hypothetical protein
MNENVTSCISGDGNDSVVCLCSKQCYDQYHTSLLLCAAHYSSKPN